MSLRESEIFYENQPYWVFKSSKENVWTVYQSGFTHSTAVQSFDEPSLAIAYCDYKAKHYTGPMKTSTERQKFKERVMAKALAGIEELTEGAPAPESRRKYNGGTERRERKSSAAKKQEGASTDGAGRKRKTRQRSAELFPDAHPDTKPGESEKPTRQRRATKQVEQEVPVKPVKKMPRELAKFHREAERAQERLQRETKRYNLAEAKRKVKELEREAKECNRNSERVGIALQKAVAHLDKLLAADSAE